MQIREAALLGVVVVLNVAASAFVKQGAVAAKGGGFVWWPYVLAIACYGAGFLAYAVSLRHVSLFVAQCFVALQFLGIIVLAWAFFSEPVSPLQWAGAALIAAGVILVGAADWAG